MVENGKKRKMKIKIKIIKKGRYSKKQKLFKKLLKAFFSLAVLAFWAVYFNFNLKAWFYWAFWGTLFYFFSLDNKKRKNKIKIKKRLKNKKK